MTEKLPHYTTLQKFSARRDVLAVAEAMIAQMGQAALQKAGPGTEVAADATGLEMTNASAHFTAGPGGSVASGRRCPSLWCADC
jgi:hypothetical protein